MNGINSVNTWSFAVSPEQSALIVLKHFQEKPYGNIFIMLDRRLQRYFF